MQHRTEATSKTLSDSHESKGVVLCDLKKMKYILGTKSSRTIKLPQNISSRSTMARTFLEGVIKITKSYLLSEPGSLSTECLAEKDVLYG